MTTTEDVIDRQEIQDWYNRINNILKRDGQTTVIVPAIDDETPILYSHISTLKDKLQTMKSDAYYSHATYSNMDEIAGGSVVDTKPAFEDTVTSIEVTIKCRNNANNSNGTNTNGSKSNGSKSNGKKSYGTDSNGYYSNGSKSNGKDSNGKKSNGTNSNGTCSFQPKGNGTCSNEKNHNGENGYGTNSNQGNADGSWGNGWCAYG